MPIKKSAALRVETAFTRKIRTFTREFHVVQK